MKGVVFSLGCKVNQCEGQSMISALRNSGLTATDKLEFADFYIINTCSVTGEADRKSRQAVARVLKLNGCAKVYVCGCSSQNDFKAFSDKPNVRIISGTAKKSEFVSAVLDDLLKEKHNAVNIATAPSEVYEDNLFPYHTKTRSYIKIQDGCNNFCSYCIVPYLRGRSRSRSSDSILEESRQAATVTKEIVFSGVNTSAYGIDIGENLCSLVRRLKDTPVRKRFGSLECTVISDELLDAMTESNFCDHFHLSLQSGSGSVLKRMNRKYTPEFYSAQVEKIRRVFPHAGITTDIIAGFGGETESEFNETLEFVRKIGFSEMHVFPYSERKGTKAYALPQIDIAVRRERAAKLIKVGDEMGADFLKKESGLIKEVYAETVENGQTVGYTSNYIKVYSDIKLGEIEKVKLTELYKKGVKGIKYE